jgi:hypothetical protein
VPKLPERKLKQLEKEAAKQAAIAEQDREAAALAMLDQQQQQHIPAVLLVSQSVQQQQQQLQTAEQVAAHGGQVLASCNRRESEPNFDEPALKRHQVINEAPVT